MGDLTDYAEGKIGTHIFRTGTFAKPTQINVALYTTLPAEDGTGGVEVSGGSYARVQHGPSDATWSAVTAAGEQHNVGAVTFPAPTADWGQVVGFGLFDEGGNLMIAAALATPKTVNNGDPAPAFADSALSITWD